MDIFDDMRSKLNANAVQELDRFQNKYTERMKNTMYGLICHAYNQGVKEGKQQASSAVKTSYEAGYKQGLESNCAAMQTGWEKGQKDLLDALKVIADKYHENGTVLLTYVRNETPTRIMEMADYYRKLEDEDIRIGDEVVWTDQHGKQYDSNKFIVTEYEKDNYIGGITLNGGTHFHSNDDGSDITRWKKTGRHDDIIGFLKHLKEDEDGGQGEDDRKAEPHACPLP